MRTLIPLALAALLCVAPAMAQDASPACPDGQVETPEGCSLQAWVDDCPPEQMCAAGAEDPQAYGDEDCIECSGPADPVQYGEDGCIDCTGTPVDPSTCMDGADEGEVCDPDVQSLGGPGQQPAPSDPEGDPLADPAADAKDAPALPSLALLAVLGAVGAVVLLSRRI